MNGFRYSKFCSNESFIKLSYKTIIKFRCPILLTCFVGLFIAVAFVVVVVVGVFF